MKILKRNEDAGDEELSQRAHYPFQKEAEQPTHSN